MKTLDLEKLAKKYGTPLYVYDLDGINQRLNDFKKAFKGGIEIHYALKANSNEDILKNFKKQKVGVDVVSWGEAKVAVDAGFKHSDIIFSGVAKTSDEITKAIKYKIKQINVESPEELIRIGEIAKKLKKKAQVAFRMNPNVSPQTHPYITTGFRENKFGMDSSFLAELRGILTKYKKNMELKGLTLHIGSQLLSLDSLREAILKTIPIYLDLKNSGYPLETFDVGGGLGIPYDGQTGVSLKEYGQMVEELLRPLDCRILCEPGRILVGEFGVLLTEVEYIKKTPYKNFAIVNTGMNHLIRPALYSAVHRIEKVSGSGDNSELYDIVGPICESSDFLGKDRYLPQLKQGDLLAILDTGAYGFSMASNYNHHAMPEEIVLKKKK
jgi:diaminopimelate decarboxylase